MSGAAGVRGDIDLQEIAAACRALYDDGNRYVKANRVVDKLDIEADQPNLSQVGRALQNVDDDVVSQWSSPVSGGSTWELREGTDDA